MIYLSTCIKLVIWYRMIKNLEPSIFSFLIIKIFFPLQVTGWCQNRWNRNKLLPVKSVWTDKSTFYRSFNLSKCTYLERNGKHLTVTQASAVMARHSRNFAHQRCSWRCVAFVCWRPWCKHRQGNVHMALHLTFIDKKVFHY